MDTPDLSSVDLLALVEWFGREPELWQAVAADKTARWPVPASLTAKLPVKTGEDTITIGAQRVTDALYMSSVEPGAVLAEMGLLLLQARV